MAELRAIWLAVEPTQANHGDLYQGIVRILMLTGQRRDEISGMRWSEIVEDYPLATDSHGNATETCTALVLPSARTKNAKPHVVPLSAPVVAILEGRRAEQKAMGITSEFVFTSTGRVPFSGFSKSKGRLDARADLAEPWRLHDLRRSAVTHMADDLRIAPHVVEAIVNHISGSKSGVAGTYNRAEHLPERRAALDAWGDYLLRHVGEVEAGSVLRMTW
jgi:integrase